MVFSVTLKNTILLFFKDVEGLGAKKNETIAINLGYQMKGQEKKIPSHNVNMSRY